MEARVSETWIQPIFLLADSQLLFWRGQDEPFLNRVRSLLGERPDDTFKAAYIGASNGDDPTFYDIFVAAMTGIHIHDCRMIPSTPSIDDLAYLDESDLILLAGGDVKRGWDVFKETGLQGKIMERYYGGAVLMGVSAGAVQLGLKGWHGPAATSEETFSTFQFVPFIIDVHDEPEWRRLNRIVLQMGEYGRGLGISSGGGAIFHPDWAVEAVRHPLVEFAISDDGIKQALIFPPDGDAQ
jgi:cyanophycinase-like exopeptidase